MSIEASIERAIRERLADVCGRGILHASCPRKMTEHVSFLFIFRVGPDILYDIFFSFMIHGSDLAAFPSPFCHVHGKQEKKPFCNAPEAV
ncbi:hypothetical protein [uncultured Desulfovibrio sp.]|uniref:hypothetical protein n=1 Tax=uncultured Desulfovibrio sp. TaxID=167968 RepID=UPI002627AA1A|nr:hypothetical protein [uncultured Desulfovibrio sp.]